MRCLCNAYVQCLCVMPMCNAYVQCLCAMPMCNAYVQCLCAMPVCNAYVQWEKAVISCQKLSKAVISGSNHEKFLFETDRQTDSGTSASVELHFAAKNHENKISRVWQKVEIGILDKTYIWQGQAYAYVQCLCVMPMCNAYVQCLCAMPVCNACVQCLYATPVCNACVQCLCAMGKSCQAVISCHKLS